MNMQVTEVGWGWKENKVEYLMIQPFIRWSKSPSVPCLAPATMHVFPSPNMRDRVLLAQQNGSWLSGKVVVGVTSLCVSIYILYSLYNTRTVHTRPHTGTIKMK